MNGDPNYLSGVVLLFVGFFAVGVLLYFLGQKAWRDYYRALDEYNHNQDSTNDVLEPPRAAP